MSLVISGVQPIPGTKDCAITGTLDGDAINPIFSAYVIGHHKGALEANNGQSMINLVGASNSTDFTVVGGAHNNFGPYIHGILTH